MKFGDFSGLAEAYSDARPKYAPQLLEILKNSIPLNDRSEILDIGAGTGIWTRMMRENFGSRITAIEPNADMYQAGVRDSSGHKIEWQNESAENYSYPDDSADLITMASSFHWADYEKAIANFKKTLKKIGRAHV